MWARPRQEDVLSSIKLRNTIHRDQTFAGWSYERPARPLWSLRQRPHSMYTLHVKAPIGAFNQEKAQDFLHDCEIFAKVRLKL